MINKRKKLTRIFEVHNILSQNTSITGNIVTNDDMRFDGYIQGNITSEKKLVIGEMAVIEGDIKCSHIDCMGKITGNVISADSVILRATASLAGNVVTKYIEIEPGAFFEGSCTMHQ